MAPALFCFQVAKWPGNERFREPYCLTEEQARDYGNYYLH